MNVIGTDLHVHTLAVIAVALEPNAPTFLLDIAVINSCVNRLFLVS